MITAPTQDTGYESTLLRTPWLCRQALALWGVTSQGIFGILIPVKSVSKSKKEDISHDGCKQVTLTPGFKRDKANKKMSFTHLEYAIDRWRTAFHPVDKGHVYAQHMLHS